MKKLLSTLFVLVMCLTLVAGCGNSGTAVTEQKTETSDIVSGGAAADNKQETETDALLQETEATSASDAAAPAEELDESVSMPLNKHSEQWDYPYAGFTLTVPESFKESKGQLYPEDGGETSAGSGIYLGSINYLARNDEEQRTFDEYLKQVQESDISDEEKQKAFSSKASEYFGGKGATVLVIMGIRGDKKLDDVSAEIFTVPISGSGEIGSRGDVKFYYVVPDFSARADTIAASMTQEYYAEFCDAQAKAADLVSCITVKEPMKSEGAEKGGKLSFTTTDLDGNTVTSEEVFKDYKVTMVNFWGTWCTYCVKELPDLEEMSKEMAVRNCRIIGICEDAEAGSDSVDKAKSILSEKGVTYTNLTAPEGLIDSLMLKAFPTTYFVDSEGNILTDPVIGADINKYNEALEEALKIVEE